MHSRQSGFDTFLPEPVKRGNRLLLAAHFTDESRSFVDGENRFAADIYLTLTDGAGEETTLCVLQSPQVGAAMDQGRYGAFETTVRIAPGRYRVTLTVAGEKRYQVDAGEIEI